MTDCKIIEISSAKNKEKKKRNNSVPNNTLFQAHRVYTKFLQGNFYR